MTKANLKTGMVIEYRNGAKRIVVKDTEFGDGFTSADLKKWKSFDAYTDDLKDVDGDTQYDIVDVYAPVNKFRVLNSTSAIDADYNHVFHRVDVRQMTMAEISEALGFAVEVIG